jgi:hypothetical protein
MRVFLFILTSLGSLAACGCGLHTIPLDSDVTFAAHQESQVFVVDRPLSGKPALVTAPQFLRLPGDPAWALRHDGKTLAAYWIDGNAGTSARAGLKVSDQSLGDVRPSWDDNAVRLRIEPPGGEPIQSDVFARTDGNAATTTLTRSAQTILDVRGRYQSALRDTKGAEIGWLRLRIGPYEAAPRIYEAALPAGVSEELAVAAVISLASEIDWIEGHTLNVYQGDRGPLIQSLPMR